MQGAVVGGVVAVIGWGGLLAYLVVLNQRFGQALGELRRGSELAEAPTVTVTEVSPSHGQ